MVPEMVSHIFREYDIRGVADRDLTDDVVRRIGQALGELLRPDESKAPPRLVVARDCRLSGPRLFERLVEGLLSSGVAVQDIGIGPTPLMYFAVHHLDADGGIMITGSHNDAPDNGFKIMRGKASFFGADIQRLKARVEALTPSPTATGTVESVDVEPAYLAYMREAVEIQAPERLRVVVDAGNGSAGPLGLRVLHDAGLNPVALYCDMDGTFPNHHPDPTVEANLEDLILAVRREGALLGLAWDGDGDRLGVVDQSGEIIWGDRLLALLARPVLEAHPGAAVIGDVKCSQGLFDSVAARGGQPIMWKTGHSLIKTKMKETMALIAGEMSGHFFFADRFFGHDDGIYAALRLLEIVSKAGKSPGELLADVPKGFSTPELRQDCPDALKLSVVRAVKQELAKEGKLTEVDGARLRYPDGAWALVRASNTGPILVMRFEAPSERRLTEIRQHVEAIVKRALLQAEAVAE
jgi:phosphomannomutase/phosphoglucomutase